MSSTHDPNSPARSENSISYIDVRDAFAPLPELPVNCSGQHNDVGYHEHVDDLDSHSIVHDAFVTLPALPDNDFGPNDFGHIDFGHDDFINNHEIADYIPDDFNPALQLALDSAQRYNGPSAPTFDEFTAQRNNEPQVLDNGDSDPEDVAARILSGALSPGQQAEAMSRMSEHSMDKMYHDLMRSRGFQLTLFTTPTAIPVDNPSAMPDAISSAIPVVAPSAIPVAGPAATPSGTLNENNYTPVAWEPQPALDPNAPPPPPPLYPAYSGRFQSGSTARAYRKRNRIAPKSHASDVERVKRYGRK
jgi:hypothetical protein